MRGFRNTEKLGINITDVTGAVFLGATKYFLENYSKSKLNLKYNCFEKHLYNEDILIEELKKAGKYKLGEDE